MVIAMKGGREQTGARLEEGCLFQNKYRVGKKLGEGGMGVVYAAVQEPSGLRVAIKLISAKEVSERNLQGERALREARALAKLKHNNLVGLYDADKTADGDYYLIMELVEGDTLRTLINQARKQGKIRDPQHMRRMLYIMAQVAEGMVPAHKAGIVHRDLKPDNVIVSEGGIAKIVDFGLAKKQGPSAPSSGVETSPENCPGTPRYMAPEHLRAYEVDPRADVYAFGVTLYEALTGRPPYERDGDVIGVTEIMGRHFCAKPVPIREHLPDCPQRVEEIVLRCLAKDPDDRYQAARDVAVALRKALVDLDDEEENTAPCRGPAPRVVERRETAPMPAQWAPGAVLPFVAAARNTLPMLPSGSASPPQPTYAAAAAQVPAGLGVGYTVKMPRPSAAEIDAAEVEVARARRGDGIATSEPVEALIYEPDACESDTTSGVHLRLGPALEPASTPVAAAPKASLERGSEPRAIMREQAALAAERKPRWPRLRVPPLYVAPILSTGIALLVLIVLIQIRDSRRALAAQTKTSTPAAPAPASAGTAVAVVPSTVATETAAPTSAPAVTTTVAAPAATEMAAPDDAPVATATAAPASAPTAAIAVRVVKPAPKPIAASTSPLPPEPFGDPWLRPKARPIAPPPRPTDVATSQSKKRPITPPRYAPPFGVEP